MYTPEQVAWGAEALGIEPEMMMAVAKKEVSGKKLTFRYKGRDVDKILYERHQFWRELVKVGINPREVLQRNPKSAAILAQTPYSRYGRFIEQYSRRDKAIEIHREAAFASCSYSGFQIMGYWFAECGYESAEAFAEAMTDHDNHIPAFVKLVKHKGLEKALRERDCAAFGEGWNGPGYYKTGYHIELSRLYQRELAASLPRHESKIAAVVNSGTLQRAATATGMGAAPAAPLLMDVPGIADLIGKVSEVTEQGKEMASDVGALHQQAQALQDQLGWMEYLPWLAGGWTLLLLLIFAAVVQRYLRDRGYI